VQKRMIIILGVLAFAGAALATQSFPLPEAQANSKVKALQACMASCRSRTKACFKSGQTGSCIKQRNACFASCQSRLGR
jgi:hypothetical protein